MGTGEPQIELRGVRKVFGDLKSAGLPTSEGEVRMKMDELLSHAREAIKNEG